MVQSKWAGLKRSRKSGSRRNKVCVSILPLKNCFDFPKKVPGHVSEFKLTDALSSMAVAP